MRKKRILAYFISFCMVLTTFGAPAVFADETVPDLQGSYDQQEFELEQDTLYEGDGITAGLEGAAAGLLPNDECVAEGQSEDTYEILV